jgi:hypothetical protein
MLDLLGQLGLHLELRIGKEVPVPAPYEVMDSLISLSVTNNDRQPDGFQMDFNIGKDTLLDYGLLKSGILDAPNRVIITALFGLLPQVLIDGIIDDLQVESSNEPGKSKLRVMGKDISMKLSFEDQSAIHPQQRDSDIVRQILFKAGFIPEVTETKDIPVEIERISTQQCHNLKFIRKLAKRNGFVFYLEPTKVPGLNIAYWGPESRRGPPQPALTMNMGAQTNMDTPPNFQYDAMGPTALEVTIMDPFTRQPIQIPIPASVLPSLTSSPAKPLRRVLSRDAANLSFASALQKAVAGASESSDAIRAIGEVDAVRYGCALRARRLVNVRGAGQSYDGTYYVQQVTHNIKRLPRGEYKMRFTLTREGRGAQSMFVAATEC